MYDRGKVLTGLAVFVVGVTLPFWLRAADRARPAGPPKLVIVTKAKECIEPTEYMRTNHMELLNSWRNDVVRHDKRQFVAANGVTYEKSLRATCMNCHSNPSEFCDRCHDYNAVDPYCWECHVEPKEKQ
jgi:hypothetical protein